MSTIDDIGAAVASVAAAAGSSIVSIGRDSRGSGVVVADGKVLTNAHNLRGSEVTVTFGDGRSTRGEVSGVDGDGASAVTWGPGGGLSMGPPVLGAPAWVGGGARVTLGLFPAGSGAFRG